MNKLTACNVGVPLEKGTSAIRRFSSLVRGCESGEFVINGAGAPSVLRLAPGFFYLTYCSLHVLIRRVVDS